MFDLYGFCGITDNWTPQKQSGLTQNEVLEIAQVAQKYNKTEYTLVANNKYS